MSVWNGSHRSTCHSAAMVAAPLRSLWRCLLMLCLTVSGAAFAQQPGCGPTDSETPSTGSGIKAEPDNSPASGLRAYIDPQTGELVAEPPPGTSPAVETTSAAARPELVEEVQPNGSVKIRLDDRFQIPLQAEVNGDQLVTCHGGDNQHD